MTAHAGRIGPNAITQMKAALAMRVGVDTTRRLFAAAGIEAYVDAPPDQMVPESEVVRLHRVVRSTLMEPLARQIVRDAGRATADYLLRVRIPAFAQGLLRALPYRLRARLLATAIARHAWTFAGSGRLTVEHGPPLQFAIEQCVLCRGVAIGTSSCDYYAATLERLFQALADRRVTVVEVECGAAAGGPCVFEVRRRVAVRDGGRRAGALPH